ncbi:agenet domain-containing protein [Raineya sp.]|jgi:hypothetical protein
MKPTKIVFALLLMMSVCSYLYAQTSDIPPGVNMNNVKKNWNVGDKAEIYWKGSWYKGSIVAGKNAQGRYKVHYDGYDSNWDEYVDIRRLRPLEGAGEEWQVGDQVEILWKGQWYKGSIISGRNSQGKYKVHYDGYDSNWDEYVETNRLRKIQ